MRAAGQRLEGAIVLAQPRYAAVLREPEIAFAVLEQRPERVAEEIAAAVDDESIAETVFVEPHRAGPEARRPDLIARRLDDRYDPFAEIVVDDFVPVALSA